MHEPHRQTSSKSIRKIGDDLQDLTTAALTTEETFREASSQLDRVTQELPDDIKQPMEQQVHLFGDHRKVYTQLLWDSREFAGSIQTSADDFASDLKGYLEDTSEDAPLASKVEAVESSLKVMQKNVDKGATLDRSTSELKNNLHDFSTGLRSRGQVDRLSSKATSLDTDINTIKSRLDQLEQELHDEESKTCGPWPFSSIRWGKSGRALELQKDIKESQDLLSNKKEELQVYRGAIDQVATVEQKVNTATKQFDDVADKLREFTPVSSLICDDFKNILSILNEKPFSQDTLTKQLERLNPTYLSLVGALTKYQNTVVKK